MSWRWRAREPRSLKNTRARRARSAGQLARDTRKQAWKWSTELTTEHDTVDTWSRTLQSQARGGFLATRRAGNSQRAATLSRTSAWHSKIKPGSGGLATQRFLKNGAHLPHRPLQNQAPVRNSGNMTSGDRCRLGSGHLRSSLFFGGGNTKTADPSTAPGS